MVKNKNIVAIHDFHMVLTDGLKMKIEKLSFDLKKTLSDTAIYIINKSIIFFKEIYYIDEESDEFSNYQNIGWDEELHIYFDKSMYRKIKHLADTHMIFSIAILIRWMFNHYFDNLYDEEKKIENLEAISFVNDNIEYCEKFLKYWDKKIENKQLSGKFYYQLTYNDKFSIIGFNFISPD